MLALTVTGITCGGCAAAIRRALAAALPGATVEIDIAKGVVAIDTAETKIEAAKSAIEEAGFTVTGLAT